MAVDATRRPLQVPPKFVPYLETHHIYDLFYDMTIALIKNRPEDVLSFMREELIEYKKRRSTQRRIIFIAPKHLDIESLASELSEETDAIVLSLSQVIKEQNLVKNDTEPFYTPEILAKATRKCLESKQYPIRGWILVGFPRNKEEAKALQKKGILPTHTLEFMHTPKDYKVDDLWNESLASWSFQQFRDMMIEYKRSAVELREIYKSTYKKIIIRGRSKERIVNECRMLLNKMQHTGAPMLPRVVLIGNRGSRRRTLGNMLSKRFNLVHVNIRALLARGGTMENSMGEQIRHADHIDVIHINISLKLLEDRLMEEDCLTHGWVLTEFPNDESDFKLLDNLDTPPNRIIFLGASSNDCMSRTQDRCINMYSGEVMSFKNTTDNNRMQAQLAIHPDDCYTTVAIEQEVFSSEIQGMIEYCESRAAIIDATGPLNEVFERVENIIMNPQACRKTDRLEPSQSLYNQLSGILQ